MYFNCNKKKLGTLVIAQHTRIEKGLFLKILKFCIEDNRYFQYNNRIYTQTSGLPMGSPASPIIADIVMEKLLDSSIERLDIKSRVLVKYVDDLFCIIPDIGVDDMLMTFNNFDRNIRITMESEDIRNQGHQGG